MGDPDICTNAFLKTPKNFADAFNLAFRLNGWDMRIDPDSLEPLDTSLSGTVPLPDDDYKALQRSCDVFKNGTIYSDQRYYYAALMIESQHYVHPAMPLKFLIYIMLDALRQIREYNSKHLHKEHLSSDEFLSRYPLDLKLKPVIPLVIFFSPASWRGARDMANLYEDVPESLKYLLPNQRYLALVPKDITDTQFVQNHSDISIVLRAMKHASTRNELMALFKEDRTYDTLSREVAELILTNVNFDTSKIKMGEKNNMTDLTHFWDEADKKVQTECFNRGKAEGLAEGVAKGKAEGLAEGLAEGVAKGKAEGLAEGTAGIIKTLMKSLNLSMTQTFALLNINDEEQINIRTWLENQNGREE